MRYSTKKGNTIHPWFINDDVRTVTFKVQPEEKTLVELMKRLLYVSSIGSDKPTPRSIRVITPSIDYYLPESATGTLKGYKVRHWSDNW